MFTAMTLPEPGRFRQTGHVSATEGLDQLADRLYALPPADFVPTRDEAAKAARSAGDRPRAAAIAKLRRPTVAAWLVNLLALRRPDELGELLALGAELRAAQHELRGPALRELASRRRAAVGALVSEACDLAVEAGAIRSGLPVAEVEVTLVAALADDALADVVRAGRLLKSGHYDGFGETPRPHLQVIEGGGDVEARAARSAPEPMPASAKPVRERERPDAAANGRNVSQLTQRTGAADARKRLDEAATALADAESAYAAAVDAVDARTREVTDIEERLTQLRRDRVAAHAALLDAQTTQDSMDAARHAAQRSLAAAERAAKRVDR
jgi:hypothetical protein